MPPHVDGIVPDPGPPTLAEHAGSMSTDVSGLVEHEIPLQQTEDVRDWLVCDDSAGRCTLGCEKGKHTYICSHVHYRLVLRDLETRRCVRMVDPRFPDHEKDVCR